MKWILPIALFFTLGTPAFARALQERSFPVQPFDAVESVASDDIRIRTGTAPSVVATGDPRALETLSVQVIGRVLHVGRTPGTHSDRGALLTVTAPFVHSITLSGSGNVEVSSLAGSRFQAILRGSGRLLIRALRVDEARFGIEGSGSIVADGSAKHEFIRLNGSGSVDARQLSTPELAIDLGGTGDIDARASRIAVIRAGGAGHINVSGHPICEISRGGTVHVRCD